MPNFSKCMAVLKLIKEHFVTASIYWLMEIL